MGISIKTIKLQRANMMNKLGGGSLPELMKGALRQARQRVKQAGTGRKKAGAEEVGGNAAGGEKTGGKKQAARARPAWVDSRSRARAGRSAARAVRRAPEVAARRRDRKSTRLNSSH